MPTVKRDFLIHLQYMQSVTGGHLTTVEGWSKSHGLPYDHVEELGTVFLVRGVCLTPEEYTKILQRMEYVAVSDVNYEKYPSCSDYIHWRTEQLRHELCRKYDTHLRQKDKQKKFEKLLADSSNAGRTTQMTALRTRDILLHLEYMKEATGGQLTTEQGWSSCHGIPCSFVSDVYLSKGKERTTSMVILKDALLTEDDMYRVQKMPFAYVMPERNYLQGELDNVAVPALRARYDTHLRQKNKQFIGNLLNDDEPALPMTEDVHGNDYAQDGQIRHETYRELLGKASIFLRGPAQNVLNLNLSCCSRQEMFDAAQQVKNWANGCGTGYAIVYEEKSILIEARGSSLRLVWNNEDFSSL